MGYIFATIRTSPRVSHCFYTVRNDNLQSFTFDFDGNSWLCNCPRDIAVHRSKPNYKWSFHLRQRIKREANVTSGFRMINSFLKSYCPIFRIGQILWTIHDNLLMTYDEVCNFCNQTRSLPLISWFWPAVVVFVLCHDHFFSGSCLWWGVKKARASQHERWPGRIGMRLKELALLFLNGCMLPNREWLCYQVTWNLGQGARVCGVLSTLHTFYPPIPLRSRPEYSRSKRRAQTAVFTRSEHHRLFTNKVTWRTGKALERNFITPKEVLAVLTSELMNH